VFPPPTVGKTQVASTKLEHDLLHQGSTQATIARTLGRSRSTISREIKRNSNKDGTYNRWRAFALYRWRRKKCVRTPVLLEPEILRFVSEGLDKFWSPEMISARWKQMGKQGLSHTTIYRGLKRKLLPGYSPKMHLRRRGRRKNLRGGALVRHNSIHARPREATLRPFILLTHTALGSAGQTRTSTGSSDSSSQKALIFTRSRRKKLLTLLN